MKGVDRKHSGREKHTNFVFIYLLNKNTSEIFSLTRWNESLNQLFNFLQLRHVWTYFWTLHVSQVSLQFISENRNHTKQFHPDESWSLIGFWWVMLLIVFLLQERRSQTEGRRRDAEDGGFLSSSSRWTIVFLLYQTQTDSKTHRPPFHFDSCISSLMLLCW